MWLGNRDLILFPLSLWRDSCADSASHERAWFSADFVSQRVWLGSDLVIHERVLLCADSASCRRVWFADSEVNVG